MSSGQWEVVGKNKKDKTSVKKQVKNEKNKIAPAPKVEDILPLSQVKNIYNNLGKNKENKKPQEKDKQKDAPKKNPAKKTEKKNDSPKPKPPKSIESALTMINIDDLRTTFELTKQRFPGANLVWLRELAAYLNAKISVELNDPVFATKPDHYPMSIVPSAIKQIMEMALKDAGKSSVEIFFHNCLSSMAVNMSKGFPSVGFKLWIQFVANNHPEVTVNNFNTHHEIKASYQNRQAIGQSILWGLGQGGFKDFDIGLKVFKEFMLPMIEMKNYSRFVVKYLSQLLTKHEKVPLSKDNFIFLFDLVNENRNLSKDDKQELTNLNKKLKNMLFSEASDKTYTAIFEALFDKNLMQKEVTDILFNCLNKDPSCYKTWKSLHPHKYEQSLILLKYIGDHWRRLNSQLEKKHFRDLLNSLLITNTELQKKHKKDSTITSINELCQVLLEKMVASKSFPWKFFTFVVFLSTVSLLVYDLNKHGSWKKTQSVQTLKQIGVWEYGEKAWDSANHGFNWTRQRIEEYAPGYLDATGEYVAPYIQLTKDLGKIAYNTGEKVAIGVQERVPVVLEMIEKQAPGLLQQIEKTWKSFSNAIVEYSINGYHYLTTQVFVGQLSPEHIQKVTLTFVDSTQKIAVEYYNWAYEKVQGAVSGK